MNWDYIIFFFLKLRVYYGFNSVFTMLEMLGDRYDAVNIADEH